MIDLEVCIAKFPRKGDFKALERVAGAPIAREYPEPNGHYVTFRFDTMEKAEAAEDAILSSPDVTVFGTNIDLSDDATLDPSD